MDAPVFADAIVEHAKLVLYLLAQDHPEGGAKARFFLACGFRPGAAEQLADALRAQARAGSLASTRTPFGVKHVVDGPLLGADGRRRTVRSVWLVEPPERPPPAWSRPIPWRRAMPLAELDRVVLTRDVPEAGLAQGDVGVIVHAYRERTAFEVEVFSLTGETVAVATVTADHLRPVGRHDVVSARVAAE